MAESQAQAQAGRDEPWGRSCHVIRRSPDDNDLVRATTHAMPKAEQTLEQCPLIRKRRAMTSTFLIVNDRTAGTCRASYQQTLILSMSWP